MIRTLLLGAGLLVLGGCSSTHKVVTNQVKPEKVAEAPKQYDYRDMSQGANAGFARRKAGSAAIVD